jgi:hypothetical protein
MPPRATMLRQLRKVTPNLKETHRLLSFSLSSAGLSRRRRLRIRVEDVLQTGGRRIRHRWSRYVVSGEIMFRYTVWPLLLWTH